MDRFLIVILVGFLVGGAFSFLMGRFFRNKVILFLPTILSFTWLIYTMITFEKNNVGGFYDLAIFLSGIIIFSVAIGNIISNIVFNRKKKHKNRRNRNKKDTNITK